VAARFKVKMILAGALVLSAASAAKATTFQFSFTGNGYQSFGGAASSVPGTVTGLIFGLTDDGNSQVPTGAEILTSPIGLQGTFLTYSGGSVDVSGGQIVGLGPTSQLTFGPNLISPLNIVLNLSEGGGSVTIFEAYNTQTQFINYVTDGTAQNPITFFSAVPEPSTWAMMILGFSGIGFIAYRRRKIVFV
jgi:hypothetical protein